MNTMIINADEARALAANLFSIRFPGNQAFFDSAWELLQSRRGSPLGARQETQALELLAVGSPDGVTMEMAQEVAIFYEAFMAKFPAAREVLIKRAAGACAKYGRGNEYIREIESRLNSVENKKTGFVVWMSKPSGLGSDEEIYSENQLPKRILDRLKLADISIKGQTVTALMFDKREDVYLEDPLFRSLVILLRYKDEFVNIRDLYLRAYMRSHDGGLDTDAMVRKYLKFSISDLRGKLRRVHNFKIPWKKHSPGYRCTGNFSFCILMARNHENEFKVRTGVVET